MSFPLRRTTSAERRGRAGQTSSIVPEFFKTSRRQLGVAHRMLDVAMAEIGLDGARVLTSIGEREAARVPEHVRMHFEFEPGSCRRACNHPGKAGRRERRGSLADKDERPTHALTL